MAGNFTAVRTSNVIIKRLLGSKVSLVFGLMRAQRQTTLYSVRNSISFKDSPCNHNTDAKVHRT